MKALYDGQLADRNDPSAMEFGRAAAYVSDLCEWANTDRLPHDFKTIAAGAETVQAEALVVLVGRHVVGALRDIDVLETIAADPELRTHPAFRWTPTDGPVVTGAERWLLEGFIGRKFRIALWSAVQSGRILLHDSITKMPVTLETKAASGPAASRQEWVTYCLQRADEAYESLPIERDKKSGRQQKITKKAVSEVLSRWCRADGVVLQQGGTPDPDYIVRWGLQEHWSLPHQRAGKSESPEGAPED